MPSKHFIASIFTKRGWQAPQWVLLCAFFVMLGLIFMKQKTSRKKFGKKLNLDGQIQDLPPYWTAIRHNQWQWTIKEEDNVRKNLGTKVMAEDCFARARNASDEHEEQSTMIGVHSYDILANRQLADDLHYVCALNRKAYMLQENDLQNNFVRAVLDLAYFRDAMDFENWVN